MDTKRLLMAYLYSIKWKGGPIFPSQEEIKNPPPDGIYKTKLTEDDLYGTLKTIYEQVIEREDKLGSHTARKTGYLFGFLRGCSDVAILMQAADHECPKIAKRYIKDAQSIAAVNRVYNTPENNVGRWESPYCAGDETSVRSCAPGHQFQKPLPDLLQGFMEEVIGISAADPKRYSPKHLFNTVVAWKMPGNHPMQDLNVSLKSQSPLKSRLQSRHRNP